MGTHRNRSALFRARAREMRHEPNDAEAIAWHHLRGRQVGGFKFRRQYAIGAYITDFYCAEASLRQLAMKYSLSELFAGLIALSVLFGGCVYSERILFGDVRGLLIILYVLGPALLGIIGWVVGGRAGAVVFVAVAVILVGQRHVLVSDFSTAVVSVTRF